MYKLNEMVYIMSEKDASDIHLIVGTPPQFRIDGVLNTLDYEEKLLPDTCKDLVYSVLTDEQKRRFEEKGELDLSFGVKGVGRIRMNVFKQRGTIGAALRNIPSETMTFKELNLPEIVNKIVQYPNGLVLVTGPTGSGKSTTLASMINFINEDRRCHIITVEDPIEYLHRHKSSIVCQREIGSDTESYSTALRHILRQDPDVILIGEMRDLETISAALTVAETGHLVFATLHTPDAIQSINRIIDVFPSQQQQQIRTQLSFVLRAVICQQLLVDAHGKGRVLACEVLVVNAAVKNIIRDNKIHQAYTLMQSGRSLGMHTMNMSLYGLVINKMINEEEAMSHTTEPNDLRKMLHVDSTPAK
ncbi:MAG: type IV pilus twitching motility protein PilT [bacterium]|nr:type IV pilus twitching motility protein PilT [bacterium]